MNKRLFSAILARDWDALIDRLVTGDVSAESFLAFADTHQLAGFLHLKLSVADRAASVDPRLLDHLESRYAEQRFRGLETLREAAVILEASRAVGQDLLFMKGPFAAERFYGEAHARCHWDVDLMIRKKDFPRADHLLQGLGYARRSIAFLGVRPMTRFAHTFEYRKRISEEVSPGQRYHLPLDLHWSLQTHFSFRIDENDMWDQAGECSIDGVRYPVIGDEHALLATLLAIFADVQLGVLSLKAVLDLDQVVDALDSRMDWAAFFDRRRTDKTFHICLGVFQLFFQLLAPTVRYASLRQELDEHRHELQPLDVDQLLERSRFAFRNRHWALALYEAPRLLSIVWSFLLVPFRVLAYESRDPAPIKWVRDLRENRFNTVWRRSAPTAGNS